MMGRKEELHQCRQGVQKNEGSRKDSESRKLIWRRKVLSRAVENTREV